MGWEARKRQHESTPQAPIVLSQDLIEAFKEFDILALFPSMVEFHEFSTFLEERVVEKGKQSFAFSLNTTDGPAWISYKVGKRSSHTLGTPLTDPVFLLPGTGRRNNFGGKPKEIANLPVCDYTIKTNPR